MYMGMAILGGLLAMVIHLKGRAWELFRVHGDAIILGVWAVTGTTKALTYGMPWASAMFMGMLTAGGGGMIRDIATGSIPSIFGGNTLYATPAIFSSAIMVGFHAIGHDAVGMIAATTLGAGFAILAYWRGWVLPTVIEQEQARRRRKAGMRSNRVCRVRCGGRRWRYPRAE